MIIFQPIGFMHDNQIIPNYQDWQPLGVHLDSWKFLLSEATRKEFEVFKALNASWYKWLEGIRSRKLTQEFFKDRRVWWERQIKIRDEANFMIRWSRNNIKQLNSPPNKNLNASQPHNYEESRSQSPTPNPFKVPAPPHHPSHHVGFTHEPGKHFRDFDSHPTRPRKRRRRLSRIDWAECEAKAQVCTHFRTLNE